MFPRHYQREGGMNRVSVTETEMPLQMRDAYRHMPVAGEARIPIESGPARCIHRSCRHIDKRSSTAGGRDLRLVPAGSRQRH